MTLDAPLDHQEWERMQAENLRLVARFREAALPQLEPQSDGEFEVEGVRVRDPRHYVPEGGVRRRHGARLQGLHGAIQANGEAVQFL